MLYSNREITITAARVGACLYVGFHLSANLIDTLSRIPISADGTITPAYTLWFIHLIYLCIRSTMCDPKAQKQEAVESTREEGGIPPLPHSLSDTAYGQTHLSPKRHNTNDRDKTPTAQGSTLGHLKQGYLEFVAW